MVQQKLPQKTNKIKKLEIPIKVILACFFVGCLFDWDYGYYQLVRFIGMTVFAILAYNQYQISQTWFVIWLASAVLINRRLQYFTSIIYFPIFLPLTSHHA